MNPNFNRFLRRRHPPRPNLESNSLSEDFSDSSDQVMLESTSLPRERVNHKDFAQRFNDSRPSPSSMQHLVLNFFLANNLKEQALTFAKESSLNIDQLKEARFMECKKIVEQLIENEQFNLLVEKVDEIDSRILANNKTLLFDLKTLKFCSLNKQNLKDVHAFVRNELLQVIEHTNNVTEKNQMLNKFETMIGGFYLKGHFEIPKDEIRTLLIKEIAKSLGLSGQSKLDEVIHVLFNVQSLILETSDLPILSQEFVYKISEFVERENKLI